MHCKMPCSGPHNTRPPKTGNGSHRGCAGVAGFGAAAGSPCQRLVRRCSRHAGQIGQFGYPSRPARSLNRAGQRIKLAHIMRRFVASFGIITTLAVGSAVSVARAQTNAGTGYFTVKVDAPQNGELKINPPIPEDHQVRAGTVLKIKATPARGFALDSGYYWSAAKSGMYFETPTPEFEVTIDQNKTVGASFIEQKELRGFKVINNVVYAQPGVKALKYDVYSPKGAKNLPGIVIIHGGGWSVNCEDVMRGLARELVRGGRYVVASVDYR